MHRPAFLIALLLWAGPARACLWDFDTVRDERRGLPAVADVLAGRWERHSLPFYRDRASRMSARLKADPADADAADNLAVAQEKLGEAAAAIATMDAKERAVPGRYTTYANRGTFHIHAGDYAAGIADLKRALAVNPDAHFGREEYQLRLAEYLLAGQRDPAVLTTRDFLGATDFEQYGFDGDQFSLRVPGQDAVTFKPNLTTGIVGMMRFGTGRSAELYLVLGELMEAHDFPRHRGLHLAYRAYQRAIELGHPRSAAIRAHLDERFGHWRRTDPAGYAEATIAAERADADAWVRDYQAFEDGRIATGQDPADEAALAGFYADHPWGVG